MVIALSNSGFLMVKKSGIKILKKTHSLCPKCNKILPADIFVKNNKVYITRMCRKHGKTEELYFGDYEMYKRFEEWAHDGKGIENPQIKKARPTCPEDCGLCNIHKSHTALGNIVVTNRCDLQCFYCFFYAKAMGYVYEPTLGQIRSMLRSMAQEKPVPSNAVQLTGGEPALRNDIIDIIKIAKEEGYDHIQLNTNGIRLANEPGFAEKIRKAGVSTIYLSFDGVTSRTNPKNHWEIPNILRNCRAAGVGIVLVPTVINGVNDHEVGDILEFGMKHVDVVRGINYQPVSLVGRISSAERKKYRITIPDVIERMENQTDGMVRKEDFYPVPTVSALTHFVEAVTNKPKYELTSHFACGAATYLFIEDGGAVPLPRFVDIKGMMSYLDDRAEDIKNGKNKTWTLLKTARAVGRFIDKKKQPKGLSLTSMMFNILVKRDYGALGALHEKSLFVGMMHFMDKFNFDVERVKRCCIHYGVPDGKILPFCTFNVIPEWYRDDIQKKFSLSIPEWEKMTGRKLSDDFYKRNPEEMKKIPDNLLEMEI